MKNATTLLTLTALLLNTSLNAQATGNASVEPVKIAKANNWQNWAFASSALLTAAGAIFVVSINNGKKVQSTSH